ncbi:hypothetical protein EDD17DRAFT_359266 [Pisolithus thermaeus]|nr:hypothetical protein EDD17DRAFT_359266 [Pisolithus thermaeus]
MVVWGRLCALCSHNSTALSLMTSMPVESPRVRRRSPQPTDMFCPVVDFLLPNKTTRQALIEPETWRVEQPDGEVQVSRVQLPLILAWAMSIHKSQGQTLERVKVDLARVFEKGAWANH